MLDALSERVALNEKKYKHFKPALEKTSDLSGIEYDAALECVEG